jgi:hypothetical protein
LSIFKEKKKRLSLLFFPKGRFPLKRFTLCTKKTFVLDTRIKLELREKKLNLKTSLPNSTGWNDYFSSHQIKTASLSVIIH